MAVTLDITGGGSFFGGNSNIESYQVSEQASPLAPDDSRGSVGSIRVSLMEKVGPLASRGLKGSNAVLTDNTNGYASGLIVGVAARDGKLSVDIDTELAFAVAEVTVPPVRGTIEACVRAWFAVVGVTDGFYFDPALPATVFSFPGWRGDLWVELKQLLAVHTLDLSVTSGMITIRPARQRELVRYRDTGSGWDIAPHDVARKIEIYFYENVWSTTGIIYPVDGRGIDEPTISANFGESTITNVKMNATLQGISQPTAQLSDTFPNVASTYTVIDKDGVQVTPQEWDNTGGSITAVIDPLDPSVVIITTRGMDNEARSPYRIATMINENAYPSLVIVGTGTFTKKTLVTLPTGADEKLITSDIGITVDNRYISTRQEAYDLGLRTARKYAGPDMGISFSAWRVNAVGAADGKRQLTFAEFNAEWDTRNAGATFDTFNTYWSGKTFNDFNALYAEKYELDYQNQTFGNVAGSRMREGEAMYRVREATISESGVTGSAEHDTLYKDFDIIWAGAKFDDFNNSVWSGLKFDDFALAPLWR